MKIKKEKIGIIHSTLYRSNLGMQGHKMQFLNMLLYAPIALSCCWFFDKLSDQKCQTANDCVHKVKQTLNLTILSCFQLCSRAHLNVG